MLGKKFDFAAYGIDIRFEEGLLARLAKLAFQENTGARGLVSAVEKALLLFERQLPSTQVRHFPATSAILEEPQKVLEDLVDPENRENVLKTHEVLFQAEREHIKAYCFANRKELSEKYNLTLSTSRIDNIATIGKDRGFAKLYHFWIGRSIVQQIVNLKTALIALEQNIEIAHD